MKIEKKILEKWTFQFRNNVGIDESAPLNLKVILNEVNVLAVFKPLSENFSGMAMKLKWQEEEIKLILINSSQNIGRQHFTVCHELYHLFYEDDFAYMNCKVGSFDKKEPREFNADLFASMLLLPENGVVKMIPDDELKTDKISLYTVLKIENTFRCSRRALLYRLKELKIITRKKYDEYCSNVKISAIQNGFNTRLYLPGNDNLVIGDYGRIARMLYEKEKISHSHYLSLMSDYGLSEEDLNMLLHNGADTNEDIN